MKHHALLLLSLSLFLASASCGGDTNKGEGDPVECPPNQVRHPQLGTCVSIFDKTDATPDADTDTSEDLTPDVEPDVELDVEPDVPDTDCLPLYVDEDRDGWGTGQPLDRCAREDQAPAGFSTRGGDCDDSEPRRSPGLEEVCDQIDNDCDADINEDTMCAFYAHTDTDLYLVDPINKTAQNVTSIEPFLDMDTDNAGNLYGLTSSALFTFDELSSTWFQVGTHNISSTANGFAVLNDSAFVTAGTDLYSIDLATAASVRVGSLGRYSSSGDCVVAKGDVLLMSASGINDDVLIRIDGATAQTTRLGAMGFDKVYGLTSAWGTLYGLTGDGELIEVDPGTGRGRLIHRFNGLTWYGAASSPQR